jgi:hypothetical protein
MGAICLSMIVFNNALVVLPSLSWRRSLTFFVGARFYISARTPNSNKLHISAMGRLGMGLLICALRKSACLLFTETARGRKYETDVRTRNVLKKSTRGRDMNITL